MKIRLYLLQTICSKSPLWGWSWRGDFGLRGKLDYYPRHLFQAQLLSRWPFPASFYQRDKTAFLGTERQRDRMAGQKGGTKGHLTGTEWQRDRTSGTEGPGQNVQDPFLVSNAIVIFNSSEKSGCVVSPAPSPYLAGRQCHLLRNVLTEKRVF